MSGEKTDFQKDYFDEPYTVGKPRVTIDSFDVEFPGPVKMAVHIRTQVWVQEAEQKYHVHFLCQKPPTPLR